MRLSRYRAGCRAPVWPFAFSRSVVSTLVATLSTTVACTLPNTQFTRGADGAVNDSADGGGPCANNECDPFQIWPPSGATIATRVPAFRWRFRGGGSFEADLEICQSSATGNDHTCSNPIQSIRTSSMMATPMRALETNRTYFWRIIPRINGVPSTSNTSWTWTFRVQAPSSAGPERPLTSWGHVLDFNANGAPDLVLSAPVRSPMGMSALPGDLFVAEYNRGSSSYNPVRRYVVGATTIPAAFQALGIPGSRAFVAGDLDGDGDSELSVGIPAYADGVGRVVLYYGDPMPADWDFSGMPLNGSGPNAAYGVAAVGVGDVNGDGFGDFAVGSPGAHRVDIYHGTETGIHTVNNVPVGPATTLTTMGLGAMTSSFGRVVAGIGDLNGDGFAEVAIGTFGVPTPCRPAQVHVHLGSATGVTEGVEFTLSGPNTPLGTPPNCTWGSVVAGVGDVNGDGAPDFAIGDPGTGMEPGSVQVFIGNGARMPTRVVNLVGAAMGGRFGAAFAGGDLDGDGLSDLVVGAPGEGMNAGRAYLFPGAPGFPLSTTGQTLPSAMSMPGELMAISLGSGSDLDGDGLVDLLVGVPGRSGGLIVQGSSPIANLGMGMNAILPAGPIGMQTSPLGLHCATGF